MLDRHTIRPTAHLGPESSTTVLSKRLVARAIREMERLLGVKEVGQLTSLKPADAAVFAEVARHFEARGCKAFHGSLASTSLCGRILGLRVDGRAYYVQVYC